jgi:carbamoyl-phosphate synthase large subunit
MGKVRVLVTGTGGRSVGSGILHSLTRSSVEVSNRWEVIAADANPFAWGLYKVKESFLLPTAKESSYIDVLNNNICKYNIQAVVPGTQDETDILLKNQDKIKTPIITNKKELMPLMMNKQELFNICQKLNIPIIPTFPIKDWKKVINEYDFPLIIKPISGTGGSKGVFICVNIEELNKYIYENQEILDNLCIQPYVGNEESEYTVGVLSDKNANIIDSIVIKRKLIGLSLQATRKYKGKNYAISTGYSQGFVIKDKKIQDFCEEVAYKLRSTGPLNIQLRVDNQTGKIYIFEIHPRFSGTTPIRADVGFNEVDIYLRNVLFDEYFTRINYLFNVAAIRAFEHVIVPIEQMLYV